MQNLKCLHALLVPLVLLVSGCSDSGTSSQTSDPATQSNTYAEGVVKIAVLTDGTVFVNSESVSIDSLASKLDSMGDIKEIWYHREAPDASEPHDNAMKAIAEIANRKLPIAMYLDRNFTQRANFGD